MLEALANTIALHGLILRGGFHPEPGEDGLDGVGTVLIVGNAGGAMWNAFAAEIDNERHPLDRWTKRVVDPIAEQSSARVVYPFGADAPPFHLWAVRAETVFPSPLGILIHPTYGLWHAYRAALLFGERIELPARSDTASPCENCPGKPCLSACPVGAFDGSAYDVAACAGHIATPGSTCTSGGCHARNACPIGCDWRYPDPQVKFHMAAFGRSMAERFGQVIHEPRATLG